MYIEQLESDARVGRFMMNDKRRQCLRETPTVRMKDARDRNISLLLEQLGSNHVVFALIEQEGKEAIERSCVADSQEYAVKGIGLDVYRAYMLHYRPGLLIP